MIIWFWQYLVSPHMTPLIEALGEQGHDVTLVAEHQLSEYRQQLGWPIIELQHAQLLLADSEQKMQDLATSSPADAIHITQSMRGNGKLRAAQTQLAKLGRRLWVAVETIEDPGLKGLGKRLIYRRLFQQRDRHIEGYLSVGYRTKDWIRKRGINTPKIYPFTYFLPEHIYQQSSKASTENTTFEFVFSGYLIPRKRPELLLQALAKLQHYNWRLTIVGAGELETQLQQIAAQLLPNRVHWLNFAPMQQSWQYIQQADCLVLPSRHDGWGMVASEALALGTRVICSDSCGVAQLVGSSPNGQVFDQDQPSKLSNCLHRTLELGPQTSQQRQQLQQWAHCLHVSHGVAYLEKMLTGTASDQLPTPWPTALASPS